MLQLLVDCCELFKMAVIQPAQCSEPAWLYELVPSEPLPIVDVAQSIKARLLPPYLLGYVEAFLLRWRCALAVAYATSLLLAITMMYVEAPAGRVAAVLMLVLGLPIGLAGLADLGFDTCRLLIREDSVVFFLLLNVVTRVLTVVLLGDLRGLYVLNNSIGFVHVVFIDARVREVRMFTYLCLVSVVVVSACLVAFVRGRVDRVNDLSLWRYREGSRVYDVRLSEYVTTGLSTLHILLEKVLYRKLRSLRDDSVLTCTLLRCRIQLVACSDRAVPSNSTDSCLLQHEATNRVQQLKFVHSEHVYDSRKIMLSMVVKSGTKPFRWIFLVGLYSLGVVDVMLLFAMPYYATDHDKRSIYAVAMMVLFTSSLAIWMVFVALYQRELLRSLVFSFDFLFYSLQVTIILFAGAYLGQWERNTCLWMASNWIWAHWVFCMDALTPLARARLRFRIWYAVPIVLVQLFGAVLYSYSVLAHTQSVPEGFALWSAQLLGYRWDVHVLPFLVSRMLLAMTWSFRLLVRLCKASNSDAIIMSGTLSYINNQSGSRITPRNTAQSGPRRSNLLLETST